MKKNKLTTCPMCNTEISKDHELKSIASLMAHERWNKATKKEKKAHIQKMNLARKNKGKMLDKQI